MRYAIMFFFLMFFSHNSFSQQNSIQKIIVKLKKEKSFDNSSLKDLFNKNNFKKHSPLIPVNINLPQSINSLDLISNLYFLEFESLFSSDIIIKELQETELFEYVEKDEIGMGGGVQIVTPNDTYFNRQWGFNNNGTFDAQSITDADVDLVESWGITTGNTNTIVCILDGGINLSHPEFSGRLWVNTLEIANNNIDDDSNGYIDDVNGWDWAYNDKDPSDDYGHGTNVAGILGANSNNNIGYAGVNWNCKLMVGKILDNTNSGFYSWWISGIYYAVSKGAKVINMSVGGSGFSQAMKDACDFAYNNNVTILACMMNTNNNTTYYPAGYSSTIAIGATTTNDYRAMPFPWSSTSGSNYGLHIDVVAPGNFIYGLSHNSNTNYNSYWSGTSQATPLVAGIVSLMYGLKPNLTVASVRSILRNTAQDLVGKPTEDVPGFDQYMGYGRVNAMSALSSPLLPLKLGLLSGRIYDEKVSLSWQTYSEENIEQFVIEYSENSYQWNVLGSVNSKGNSQNNQNYSFTATLPVSGILYFRLKVIETDRTRSFSNICKLSSTSNTLITIKSNQVTNSIIIKTNLPRTERLKYQINSLNGNVLLKENKIFDKGTSYTEIKIKSFAAGIYVLIVMNERGEILFSNKFLKHN